MTGVTILAIVESIIVFLQYLHIIPSKNPSFACTGTWVNPNVTATFLAMAVFAGPDTSGKNKIISYAILAALLLAIVALKCRTAGVVAFIFIMGRYGPAIIAFLHARSGLGKKTITVVLSVVFLALICFAAFRLKEASTYSRLQVWKNCFSLIKEKPLFGQGFGMFEKSYNLFVAENNLPSSGHVNMPYNDFLELAVTGGLVSVALWIAFLIASIRFCIKNNHSILPVIAFGFVELVNFGFQAIPVFALFIVYTGMFSRRDPSADPENEKRMPAPLQRTIAWSLLMVSILFISGQMILALGFYRRTEIVREYPPADAIHALGGLNSTLGNYCIFHEAYGDAYLKNKQYALALQQYTLSLRTSSSPEILSKCGYCCQQQKRSDSSIYYYSIAQNIEPYKFEPRVALLRIYQQKGDSALVRQKAREIIDMPVKVGSDRVNRIKTYALNLVKEK
jgi:hypothetical protein